MPPILSRNSMATYMTHPDHGTHIAYSEAEIETCKQHGWSLRDEPKEAPKESEVKAKRKYTRKVKNDHGE